MANSDPMRSDFMGKNGFIWWQGVVEDIYDPLKLGRVRVRVLGWHTDDKSDIPTKDLPWAHVVMPVNSTSVSGKGWSPTGLVQGTWVIGFFRDGQNSQEPVVLGTIGGINTVNIPIPDVIAQVGSKEQLANWVQSKQAEVLQSIEKSKNDVGIKPYQMMKNPTVDTIRGFSDPEGLYPLISRMGEADTNRLARGDDLDNTIIKKKNDSLEYCPVALYGDWTEPKSPYAARYPFNHVYESQAGHVIEYDDTPGAERMHFYHCSGSFTEIHPLGSEVHKVVGNAWDITLNDKMILVKGNCSFNANKTLKILMGKDLEIEVFGDTKMLTRGDMTLDVGGNFLHKVGGTYTLASEGNMVMIAPRIDLNPEGENASSIKTFLDKARSFVNGMIQKVSGVQSTSEIQVTKPTPPTNEEVTAIFAKVEGRVQYRATINDEWKPAHVGDPLLAGYEIRSGLNSYAVLNVTQGKKSGTLTINSGTVAKVPNEISENSNEATKIGVTTGKADFKVDEVGFSNDFRVIPPSNVLGVRG
jgi:hypothetical protein